MGPKRAAKAPTATCTHKKLRMTPSNNAEDAGFQRPDLAERKAAMPSSVKSQGKGKKTKLEISNDPSWPGPLVLPGDALDIDSDDPPQDFKEWMSFYVKHPVTKRRRVVYIAAPPQVDPDVAWCQNWCEPNKKKNIQHSPPLPDPSVISGFVSAFYQGLPVKLLPPESLRFSQWPDEPVKGKGPQKGAGAVGLNIGHELIRIRTRSCPDRTFGGQMNLNDLIDGAISMLPDDAFALMMIVGQDLYEDDDDEFVCGRAYGGSRVAVISQARYNPAFDTAQGVERDHAWPASHCEEYIRSMCGETESEDLETMSQKNGDLESFPSPNNQLALQAALNAHVALPSLLKKTTTNFQLTGLWLARVARTVSHELGHCFGIDHCAYYACSMQASATIQEDARQPAYLCPIDQAKLLHATGGTVDDRYQALLTFLDEHKDVHMFAAYAAWIRGQLERRMV